MINSLTKSIYDAWILVYEETAARKWHTASPNASALTPNKTSGSKRKKYPKLCVLIGLIPNAFLTAKIKQYHWLITRLRKHPGGDESI